MKRFNVSNTPLDGVKCIERIPANDNRGNFARIFCEIDFHENGWREPVRQINITNTMKKGTVRGMHYQSDPKMEAKIVTCLKGEIFDVVVDVRENSSTYLKWHSEILTGENNKSLLIPKGYAHGFQALSNDVEVLYFHSEFYSPECEAGINPTDPKVGIAWPLPISHISKRDISFNLR